MKLTFLGTKGMIEETSRLHRRHSCLLVEHKDTRLLVDFGKDWQGELETINPTHILLTHSHPDHAGGFDSEVEIPVYAPAVVFDTHPDKDLFLEKVRMRRFEDYKVGDLTVRAVPVSHSIKFPAFGYLISAGNVTIGYFPDVLHITNYKRILQDVDVYIGDGAYLEDAPGRVRRTPDGRPYGHALIRDQVRWAAQCSVSTVIFTHFGTHAVKEPDKLKKALEQLEKEFNVKVIAAYDGMQYQFARQATYPGLYLVEPHARLIAEGKKTLILSTKPVPERYFNRPLLLIEDEKAYGFVRITNVLGPFDESEIRERWRDKHQVSDEEFERWGWRGKQLYAYEFKFTAFDEPVPVKVPQGAQKWVRSVTVELADPAKDILKLWEDVKKRGIEPFTDEVWLKDERWFGKKVCPTREHEFLFALSWAHRPAEQQLRIYHNVREHFDKLGKHFHELTTAEIRKFPFEVEWQFKYLAKICEYLRNTRQTFDKFVERLKELDPLEVKHLMQGILETPSSKIIEVWMRDYLVMDAFPIDMHVADVLRHYKIPPDSDLIVSVCKLHNIPVRTFARAVYSLGEEKFLVRPAIVKEVLKNPDKLREWTDEQLFDDHRITHMWAGKDWKTLPHDLTREEVRRFHDLLIREIKRRGLTFRHTTPLASPEEVLRQTQEPSPYAPIHRYGQTLGREISIDEVLEAWSKPILLVKGYVKLVGGIANWGRTDGDIDVRIEEEDLVEHWPVVFRLGRALPPDISWRAQYHNNRYPAFTSFVDVYDLALIPSERRLVRMGSGEVGEEGSNRSDKGSDSASSGDESTERGQS